MLQIFSIASYIYHFTYILLYLCSERASNGSESVSSTSSTWHLDYTVPPMPVDVQNLLNAENTVVRTQQKWRSKIIQALFEDVIKHTW